MFIRLLFIFVLVPALELYVLFRVHDLIGLSATLALILFTGLSGAYLAKTQGLAVLTRIRAELEQGRLPGSELMNGAMVLAGGLLLLTPGFCTDLLGFVLLVPLTREWLKRGLGRYLQHLVDSGRLQIRRY